MSGEGEGDGEGEGEAAGASLIDAPRITTLLPGRPARLARLSCTADMNASSSAMDGSVTVMLRLPVT
jgi:hypothetical protein